MTLEQADPDRLMRLPWVREVDWDAVYAKHLPRIYNYFRFRLGSEADVEDLTSLTFVLIDNPYLTWNQINPALAAARIEIYGPLPDAALRETLFELVMEAGCDTYPWIRALKPSAERRYEETCHVLRDDGAFIEAAIFRGFRKRRLRSCRAQGRGAPFAVPHDHRQGIASRRAVRHPHHQS